MPALRIASKVREVSLGEQPKGQACHGSLVRAWSLNVLIWIAAIAPYQAIYVAHYLRPGGTATGFIQNDMPYYVANGREVFERGNGWAYPNPFDISLDAPVIYFHWLVWCLGWGVVQLELDPGTMFATLGVVTSVLLAALTWQVVCTQLPDHRYRRTLFLLTMWGGGVLCVASAIENVVQALPWHFKLLRLDPAEGFWFLNWGRNTVLPTESTYHCLAIGAWWCAMRARWGWALLSAAVLAATHPWSGLEVLGAVTLFLILRVYSTRKWQSIGLAISSASLLASFLGYNLVYLPSFPHHHNLYEVWQIDWSMTRQTALLAYGPLLLVVAYRITCRPLEWQEKDWFLLVCALVAFALIFHDRFIRPKQPLHFTRGYEWMPLCLLALPVLQAELKKHAIGLVACLLMLALASLDNAVFCAVNIYDQYHHAKGVRHLSHDVRTLFHLAEHHRYEGVLVCPDRKNSYLAAVYSRLAPFASHHYNTPQIAEKLQRQNAWLAGTPDTELDLRARYVLLPANVCEPFLRNHADWRLLHECGEWVLLTPL